MRSRVGLVVKAGRQSYGLIGAGEDVYHSYGANQGFIVGRDACLVFDTGFHNRTAKTLLSLVKHRAKQIYVVDSHYHSDHTFGNSVLVKAGGTVIAQSNCALQMAKLSPALLSRYKARNSKLAKMLKGVEVSLPSVIFSKNLTIDLGKENTVDIVHPVSRAHTDGDAVVVSNEDRVVYAGDIFWRNYHPNLEDADIKGQIRALDWIVSLDPKKVVPGHGQVSTAGDVERAAEYLEKLRINMDKSKLVGHPERILPPWSRRWKMKWLMDTYLKSRTG